MTWRDMREAAFEHLAPFSGRGLFKLTPDEAFDMFCVAHDVPGCLSLSHIEDAYKGGLQLFRAQLRRGEARFCGVPIEVI